MNRTKQYMIRGFDAYHNITFNVMKMNKIKKKNEYLYFNYFDFAMVAVKIYNEIDPSILYYPVAME